MLSSDSYVGLDCEMVSTDNDKNALARVSIVNIDGTVLLDTYVKPDDKVVNYRTFVTGIRPRHLNSAKSFEDARKEVKKIIKNKIIVGHAVHHDLKALKLEIDESKLRDTQSLYSKEYGIGSISLQKLCFQTLGRMIQVGHHLKHCSCPIKKTKKTGKIKILINVFEIKQNKKIKTKLR